MDTTRIASLHYPDLDGVTADSEHPWSRLDEIRVLIRRHLPKVTASLFARAQSVPGHPGRIDWYSDLAGHPVAFDTLLDADQARVIALVDDRLRSLRQLADELESAPTPNADMAGLLRRAARYPHASCIYLMDGEPVLTYWGLETRGRGPVAEPPVPRSRLDRLRPLLFSALALVLLAGLGFGLWSWWQAGLQADLRADLDAGLALHCTPTALLEDLQARLDRIDPDGERFPALRLDTERELNRCADAADLDARVVAAWDDCARLPELADTLDYYELTEPPFAALKSRLDRRMADCRLAEDLHRRLAGAVGDCEAVMALATEHQNLTADDYPLAEPIMEIAAESAACQVAAEMGPRLAAANGDCWALRELDRDLGQRIAGAAGSIGVKDDDAVTRLDRSRAPLAALDEELDVGLRRCGLADHLTERFAEGQGDCVALFSLRETLAQQDTDGPPFDGIIRRLDESLSQCAALTELETRFTQVQGACDRVADFSGELERWRDNLRFADIRARVAIEQGICKQADALTGRIADLGLDCPRLRAMAGEVADHPGTQFDQVRTAFKAKLAQCDTRARYVRRFEAAGSHCGRLKALERDLRHQTGAYLDSVRARLAQALKPCRPKPKPKPVVAKPPRGSGAYALSGQCSGNLVISPAGGYHGDRVRHTVSIAPPVNARIGRVVSDNRGCRNCRLTKRNATTWSVGLYYNCSGRGDVPIAYSAFDRSGKLVCSGRGVARCLGRRR